jgi:hypothetical protein
MGVGVRRCLLLLLAATAASVVVRGAALSDNTVRLLPSKFRLVQNIGPLRYTGENRYSDRRLGRSFGFGTSGISLTIYVYDYGFSDLSDGPDSVAACEQYEKAKREIEAGGNYQNVKLRREVTRQLGDTAQAPRAREALYELDRNGIHAMSALWLTVADGYFVKLRLSLRQEVADEFDEARASILEAMANSLSMRPARPAPAEPAREPTIDIDASGDPADAALWLAYAMELARRAEASPAILPPCGGTLQPDYATERAARRVALDEYRRRAADERTSEYFDALSRVDTAGFFDEYVWTFLRNPARDTTTPAALALDDFEKFRTRELGAHRVETGAHVRVHTVRALPLAATP